MTGEVLKPCPFCGGAAEIEEIVMGDVSNYSAGCIADEACCMGFQSMTQFARRCEAVEAWNTRAPDPSADALRAENEALREALTPSAETKAAYIGEFQFSFPAHDSNGDEVMFTPTVPWVTVKKIMEAISSRARQSLGGRDGG